jgi:hypothetical protein
LLFDKDALVRIAGVHELMDAKSGEIGPEPAIQDEIVRSAKCFPAFHLKMKCRKSLPVSAKY